MRATPRAPGEGPPLSRLTKEPVMDERTLDSLIAQHRFVDEITKLEHRFTGVIPTEWTLALQNLIDITQKEPS